MGKAMLLLAVLGLTSLLLAADPFTGTWKLSIPKSKLAPSTEAAPKEETLVIREVGADHEGSIKGTRVDGSAILEKWTVPLQGGFVKYQQGGPATGSSYIETRIDAGEVYWTLLQNGKQTSVSHFVVSQDGKTLFGTTKGTDAKGKPFEALEVWEKK